MKSGREKKEQKKPDAKHDNRPSGFNRVFRTLRETIIKKQKTRAKMHKEPEFFSWAVDADD